MPSVARARASKALLPGDEVGPPPTDRRRPSDPSWRAPPSGARCPPGRDRAIGESSSERVPARMPLFPCPMPAQSRPPGRPRKRRSAVCMQYRASDVWLSLALLPLPTTFQTGCAGALAGCSRGSSDPREETRRGAADHTAAPSSAHLSRDAASGSCVGLRHDGASLRRTRRRVPWRPARRGRSRCRRGCGRSRGR